MANKGFSHACTVIYYADGNIVLAGNNEDWKNPNTQIRYIPSEDGAHGRVYFGFDDGFPQGGMNDQGLFFDGLATAPNKVTGSKNKPSYEGDIMDDAMAQCASVKEVLDLLDKYNLDFMERFMLMIGDRFGDSAIIEGDDVVRIKGAYQISTNFYQSKLKRDQYTCDRYNIADSLFQSTGEFSVEFFRQVLAAVHQEGSYPTQYSNIYDLKNGIIYLYHFHNFENVVIIDLKQELAKGAHSVNLPSLFPRTYAAERFVKDSKPNSR